MIAYEILTGERPFQGEHLSTVVYKIVAEQPAEAHRINGTLTPQIHEVLRRGLAKKPEDRYPTCSNFVGALEMACAESRGWRTLTAAGLASMPTIGVAGPVATETTALPTLGAGEKAARRSPLLVPFLMSMLVVLVVTGAILWQAGMLPSGIIPPGFLGKFFARNQETERTASNTVAPRDTPSQDLPPAAPEPQQAVEPASQQTAPAETQPPPAAPEPAVRKPSPFGPPVKSQPTEIVRIPTPRNQDVWVTTNPSGAKATLDDDLAQSCQTPCSVPRFDGRPSAHDLAGRI